MYLSPPHLYSPFDTPNVPLDPSPRAFRVPIRELFPKMATDNDNPSVELTPKGVPLETSETHVSTADVDPISLLLENFHYVSAPYNLTSGPGATRAYSAPLVPPGYNSLDDDFSNTSGEASLFHNPIWSSRITPTTGLFVRNVLAPT